MIFLLDTNVISDLLVKQSTVTKQIEDHKLKGDHLILCQPVYYELIRGLIRANAINKQNILQNKLLPSFQWQPLDQQDWQQAAQYWSNAISAGKQLSDMDFLIAALATRLNATLVSADDDFDALPITRENWRQSVS